MLPLKGWLLKPEIRHIALVIVSITFFPTWMALLCKNWVVLRLSGDTEGGSAVSMTDDWRSAQFESLHVPQLHSFMICHKKVSKLMFITRPTAQVQYCAKQLHNENGGLRTGKITWTENDQIGHCSLAIKTSLVWSQWHCWLLVQQSVCINPAAAAAAAK